MEAGKCKHNYLKELWQNRPWVYIPEVVRYMRKYPYHKKTDYFWGWLRNCFYLNWMSVWRMFDDGRNASD